MLACHCIFGMYGFWLPNDPRGSGSDYVASWELFRSGRATKVVTTRSVASAPRPPTWQATAQSRLRWPAVRVTGQQAVAIAAGFGRAAEDSGYQIHALAVLPDHVHLVLAGHDRPVRQIVGQLKSRATVALKAAGRWYDDGRPVWGAGGWNVLLETIEDVRRAIRYVENNPAKEELRSQRWSLVTPFVAAQAGARFVDVRKRRSIGGAALESQAAARRKRRG